MKKVIIEIDCENDAFQYSYKDNQGCEVARILHDMADTFHRYDTSGAQTITLNDRNGQKTGTLKIIV